MYTPEESMGSIPEETIRIAQAAFPKGNVHMRMRDTFGVMFDQADFKRLYSRLGQPGIAPWRLLLVMIMQYAENLSDRQAADAVRGRIDWKYVLGLALDDSGFDYSVLSEFRDRLMEGQAEQVVLDRMLAHFQEHGLVAGGGRQRSDSTHVLAAVRSLNRLELVGETLRATLNNLAHIVPDWLREQVPLSWYERYSKRFEDSRFPQGAAERQAFASTLGQDGAALLQAIDCAEAFPWLKQLPSVDLLRRVWHQQYMNTEGTWLLRPGTELESVGERVHSPYDPEAHYAVKRGMGWTGYKVHVTETCDTGTVHVLTHVETTAAEIQDVSMTARIQQALVDKGLPPDQHIVDSGYIDAELLATSPVDQGIDLLGPARPNSNWQAKAGQGFDVDHFHIDWQRQQVSCPQGHLSQKWLTIHPSTSDPVIHVLFAKTDCQACPVRALCTHTEKNPRALTLYPQPIQEALQAARQRQMTPAFKAQYAIRAGIEGTLSEGIRAHDLRRSRYIGLAKTHLQHVLTVLAINWIRVAAWLGGAIQARTRVSPFAALAPS